MAEKKDDDSVLEEFLTPVLENPEMAGIVGPALLAGGKLFEPEGEEWLKDFDEEKAQAYLEEAKALQAGVPQEQIDAQRGASLVRAIPKEEYPAATLESISKRMSELGKGPSTHDSAIYQLASDSSLWNAEAIHILGQSFPYEIYLASKGFADILNNKSLPAAIRFEVREPKKLLDLLSDSIGEIVKAQALAEEVVNIREANLPATSSEAGKRVNRFLLEKEREAKRIFSEAMATLESRTEALNVELRSMQSEMALLYEQQGGFAFNNMYSELSGAIDDVQDISDRLWLISERWTMTRGAAFARIGTSGKEVDAATMAALEKMYTEQARAPRTELLHWSEDPEKRKFFDPSGTLETAEDLLEAGMESRPYTQDLLGAYQQKSDAEILEELHGHIPKGSRDLPENILVTRYGDIIAMLDDGADAVELLDEIDDFISAKYPNAKFAGYVASVTPQTYYDLFGFWPSELLTIVEPNQITDAWVNAIHAAMVSEGHPVWTPGQQPDPKPTPGRIIEGPTQKKLNDAEQVFFRGAWENWADREEMLEMGLVLSEDGKTLFMNDPDKAMEYLDGMYRDVMSYSDVATQATSLDDGIWALPRSFQYPEQDFLAIDASPGREFSEQELRALSTNPYTEGGQPSTDVDKAFERIRQAIENREALGGELPEEVQDLKKELPTSEEIDDLITTGQLGPTGEPITPGDPQARLWADWVAGELGTESSRVLEDVEFESGKIAPRMFTGESVEGEGVVLFQGESPRPKGRLLLSPLTDDDYFVTAVSSKGEKARTPMRSVQDVHLDESLRGKGLGVRMYEEAIAYLGKQHPQGFLFVPSSLTGSGATTEEAERVWNSLRKRYMTNGESLYVGPKRNAPVNFEVGKTPAGLELGETIKTLGVEPGAPQVVVEGQNVTPRHEAQRLVANFRKSEQSVKDFDALQEGFRRLLGATEDEIVLFRGIESEGFRMPEWEDSYWDELDALRDEGYGSLSSKDAKKVRMEGDPVKARRYNQLLWVARSSGSQFFSDQIAVALSYAGSEGTVYAIKVPKDKAIDHWAHDNTTPNRGPGGGLHYGSNFVFSPEDIKQINAAGGFAGTGTVQLDVPHDDFLPEGFGSSYFGQVGTGSMVPTEEMESLMPWQKTSAEFQTLDGGTAVEHKAQVRRAVSQGFRVPALILEEYPDLQQAYGGRIALRPDAPLSPQADPVFLKPPTALAFPTGASQAEQLGETIQMVASPRFGRQPAGGPTAFRPQTPVDRLVDTLHSVEGVRGKGILPAGAEGRSAALLSHVQEVAPELLQDRRGMALVDDITQKFSEATQLSIDGKETEALRLRKEAQRSTEALNSRIGWRTAGRVLSGAALGADILHLGYRITDEGLVEGYQSYGADVLQGITGLMKAPRALSNFLTNRWGPEASSIAPDWYSPAPGVPPIGGPLNALAETGELIEDVALGARRREKQRKKRRAEWQKWHDFAVDLGIEERIAEGVGIGTGVAEWSRSVALGEVDPYRSPEYQQAMLDKETARYALLRKGEEAMETVAEDHPDIFTEEGIDYKKAAKKAASALGESIGIRPATEEQREESRAKREEFRSRREEAKESGAGEIGSFLAGIGLIPSSPPNQSGSE